MSLLKLIHVGQTLDPENDQIRGDLLAWIPGFPTHQQIERGSIVDRVVAADCVSGSVSDWFWGAFSGDHGFLLWTDKSPRIILHDLCIPSING